MIFNTLSQLNSFFIFLFFGIIIGFISIVYFSITLKNHRKNLLNIIFDTIFYCFFSVFYVFLINFFNFGKFSLTLACVFILGFVWVKTVFKNLLVILENKCYNIFNKARERMLTSLKRKQNQRKNKLNEPAKKS